MQTFCGRELQRMWKLLWGSSTIAHSLTEKYMSNELWKEKAGTRNLEQLNREIDQSRPKSPAQSSPRS